MIRTEWWRDEVHVEIAALTGGADVEEIVRNAVKGTLARQGGVGDAEIRAWRVRCSPRPGCIRFVLQGHSKRRVA